mmetsp:Transcript_4712/g.9308  ORF Transcript_4712/g.9308 Transcript_4712/m.9308 type:complete len:469 (-) Transcript_4712:122-1528(-)
MKKSSGQFSSQELSTMANPVVVRTTIADEAGRSLFVFPPRNSTTGNLFDYSSSAAEASPTSNKNTHHQGDKGSGGKGSRHHVFGTNYHEDYSQSLSSPVIFILMVLSMSFLFLLSAMLFLYCYCDVRRGRCGFRRRLHEGDLSIHSSNMNNDNNSQRTEQARERARRERKVRSEWVEKSLVTTTYSSVFDDSMHTMKTDVGTSSSGSVSTASKMTPILSSASSTAHKISYEREREEHVYKLSEQKDKHEPTNTIFHLPNFLFIHNSNQSSNTNDKIEDVDSSPSSSSCAICLEPYRQNDEISYSKHQKCSHVFHKDCIISWLTDQKRDDCPYCRGNYIQKVDGDNYVGNDESRGHSYEVGRGNDTSTGEIVVIERENIEGNSGEDLENGTNVGDNNSQTVDIIDDSNDNDVQIENAEDDPVPDVENVIDGGTTTSQTFEIPNNYDFNVQNETANMDMEEGTRARNLDD